MAVGEQHERRSNDPAQGAERPTGARPNGAPVSSQLLEPTPAGVGKEVNGAVMSNSTRADFDAEVAKLKTTNNSGPSDRRVASLGMTIALIGLVVIVVMYSKATGQGDQRDQ